MPKKAPAVQVIACELAFAWQDVIYTETLRVGDYSLRIKIRSDAYDFQSFARVSLFSPATGKWSVLHSLSNRATSDGLVYRRPKATEADFAADRETLLKAARAILGL